jgi:hypothetical protein
VSESVAYVVIALSLVVMAWAGWLTIRDRRLSNALFYVAAALEIVLLAVVIGGFVALAVTDRSVDGVTFGGYLLTIVVIMPIGVAWGASDKSRWGTGVIVIAAFVVVVLTWRLVQIWQGIGV